jgi:pimeloyl-ACP methyl ester carboxylesterase
VKRRNQGSLLAILGAFGCLSIALDTMAQDMNHIEVPTDPLVLESRGSFFVGGEVVHQSFVELGSVRPADTVTVNQMFVEFMIAEGAQKPAVVMIHGAGLSGHSYDTTPDGRMGWYEYFVRKSHPVYVVDQVGRARSGFNQATYNNVGAGLAAPAEQPKIRRMGDHYSAWMNFRFGPERGVAFPDSQFPVAAAAELSKQGIPDLDEPSLLASNYDALATLSRKLGGAVLMGHSQSGAYPLEVALRYPDVVRAMIMVEPGSCNEDKLDDKQVAILAKIPLLVVHGDHLSAPTFVPGPGWQDRFDACERLIGRLRKANGHAEMLHPPRNGIHGNSHLIMQDNNNLQIADLILGWLDRNISSTGSRR